MSKYEDAIISEYVAHFRAMESWCDRYEGQVFATHMRLQGWIADLLHLDGFGWCIEIEAKNSRADLLKDFKATRASHTKMKRVGYYSALMEGGRDSLPDRERLGIPAGFVVPNMFAYLTPRDLIDAEDLPPYAGLFVRREMVNDDGPYVGFEAVKHPVVLHSEDQRHGAEWLLRAAHSRLWDLRTRKLQSA